MPEINLHLSASEDPSPAKLHAKLTLAGLGPTISFTIFFVIGNSDSY